MTYLDGFPPQDDETLGSHSHEPGKLFTQDPLDLVGLFDADGEPDRVDTGFDEDAFGFVTGDEEGLEKGLLGVSEVIRIMLVSAI